MKKKKINKSLILVKGKKINFKLSWEEFEERTREKYSNNKKLAKYKRRNYKELELKIEELYYNNVYDKIYELLLADDNGTYENSIVSWFARENAAKYGYIFKVNVDIVELESKYQEHLFNLLEGIADKSLMQGISFFQSFKKHCEFITRDYIRWIFRQKRVGNYRYSSLDKLQEEYGYEPIDMDVNIEDEVITKLYIEDKSFTNREQLVMKAIIKENKISQRQLIGIDGMKRVIQVQRVYRNIKKKWES